MYSQLLLSVLAASAHFSFVAAVPATDSTISVDPDLRLIKTSEADPGTWVTDDEKIENYVSKSVRFYDITDVTDKEFLKKISTAPTEADFSVSEALVTYPTTLTHATEANTLIAQATTSGPQSWLTTLTNFYNRYYKSTYGTQAGTWLVSQLKTIAAANANITVSTFTHSYSQPSIIVTIPGSTSNLIVLGAHYDSTGGSSTAKGPGADDNGSGVVVQMEALRILASAGFYPKNTIEFHFYSGEEGGLLGSTDVWKSYKSAGKSVYAMVCQDMAGWSPSGKISVYNDYADTSLTAYVKKVVVAYSGVSTYTTDTCGYACSDHASAYNNGFPAAYVCDEPIATSDTYIHSPNDAYSTIEWDTVLRHIKFTIGFLVEASYI